MTREEKINALPVSDDKKNEFRQVYEQYEEKKEDEYWRLERLLPLSQYLLESQYNKRKEVKCLFSLVGTSLDPILLSILTIRPKEKLVLIYSDESETVKNKIVNTLKQNFVGNIIPKDNLQDVPRTYIENISSVKIEDARIENTNPETVFAAIKSRIEHYADNEIGVDITGGKKSMVGGAFLSAAVNRYSLFYLDFDEYDGTEPLPGSEFIHILQNPYDIYSIDLINQAKELFRRHNYASAEALLAEVEKKIKENKERFGLEEELKRVEAMRVKAEFYKLWDSFEYEDANNVKADVPKESCQTLKSLILSKGVKKIYEAEKQFEYVKKVALDRFANGERREKQGRYEDAMTRYAQAVEIACKSKMIQIIEQKKLRPTLNGDAQEDITWRDVELDRTEISRVFDWLFLEKQLKIKGNEGEYIYEPLLNQPLKITFMNVFGAINDSDIKHHKRNIGNRNDFIHVSSLSAKEKKMKEFKKFAEKMLKVIYGNVDCSPYKFPDELN